MSDYVDMSLIHHITHIDNIPTILSERGLMCDAEVARRSLCSQSIAYDSIKQRRSTRRVEKLSGEKVAAGGSVADYVPFYFCNRSPMLAAIHNGYVAGYQKGQENVIYLVSTVEAVASSDLVWCFTDGHAAEEMTEFYDRLEGLSKVDWKAVETWRWGGRWLLDNPDVKRRKQAEFLVHHRFPWDLILQIGVMNQAMANKINELLRKESHIPRVTIQRKWYYD